jgi:hypothetical protein
MGYLAGTGAMGDSALRKAVVYGSAMASFNVTGFGPEKIGDLTFTEIEARYQGFRKLVSFEDAPEAGTEVADLKYLL